MSFTKRASRRIGLLAGSSFITAGLSAAASLAVVAAPTSALAYDECLPATTTTLSDGPGGVSDPTLNGATPDSFTCSGSHTSTGVSYTSAGALTVTTSGLLTVGSAGLELVGSGTDSILLNVTGGRIEGGAGNAIRIITGGSATIGITTQTAVESDGLSAAIVDLTTAASATTTIDNAGFIRSTASALNTDNMADDLALRGAGAGSVVINNSGGITGRVDFSAQTGPVTFNIANSTLTQAGWSDSDSQRETGWFFGGTSTFTGANDTLSTSATGIISTSPGGLPDAPGGIATTINFSAGVDTFNNAGALIAGVGRQCGNGNPCFPEETITTLENLETFNNSGMILLGANLAGPEAKRSPLVFGETDHQTNDTLAMPGTTFTGSGGSRIGFDVTLAGVQTACTDRVADCVDITGGATAGSTLITVNDVFPGFRGVHNPGGILLIDVAGGTSAAEHFTLDPNSDFYDDKLGVLNKGDFIYALVYDEDNQRHVLASAPGENMQFAPLGHAAHSVWRDSAATYFDRQVDLRDTVEDRSTGGIWMRTSSMSAKRDLEQTSSIFGTSYSFDNTYKQDTLNISAGIDILANSGQNSSYALGLMLGYAKSDVEFQEWNHVAEFNGATGGVYGSFIAGHMFVDALVFATGLTMDNEIANLNLFPEHHHLTTNVKVLGAQAEAGWRLPLFGTAFVEPLVGVSYAKASFDDLKEPDGDIGLAGNTVTWDDPRSFRTSIGARFGLSGDYGPVLVRYAASAKLTNELDGESGIVLGSSGPDALVENTFDGTFTDLGASIGVIGDNGLSAVLDAKAQLSDDYRNVGMGVGVRYQW